jgi:hypothetical protein
VSRLALLAALLAATTVPAGAAPPEAIAKRCTATQSFDIYAIPSGYEDGVKDVFAKGVPRKAKNIRLRFVRVRDGRPVGTRAFPLQTWAARLKGFRSDGTLWVQITLAGFGYGMPVANGERWRAVISYDC